MNPNRISLVRIDKQQQRKVSAVTLSKLMDKLKANVSNNELAMLRFKVKNADLASFDEQANAWVTDAGRYEFLLGASSRDIKASLSAEIKGSSVRTNALSFDK